MKQVLLSKDTNFGKIMNTDSNLGEKEIRQRSGFEFVISDFLG